MNRKILVLEDEPTLNRLFTKALQTLEAVEVFAAQSLHEAWQVYTASSPFDLMIVDIHLPDGSGLDFLRQVWEELQQAGTRILILTAQPRHREEARAMGIEWYLEKPVSLQLFRLLVTHLLQGTLSHTG